MSAFTKPPNQNSGASGPAKPDAHAKPAAPPAPRPAGGQTPATQPAVVVTRTIEVGGPPPKSQARPSAPTIQIGPPLKQTFPGHPGQPVAPAPPQLSKTPTLKIDAKAKSEAAAKAEALAATQPAAAQAAPPKSVRPTAPALTPADGMPSLSDTFEKLLSHDDVEAGFAALDKDPGSSPHIDVGLTDLSEVRTLFAQLAANHVRQVRDFMIDLRWSGATADWVGVCLPALNSLRRAADKLDLLELCTALDHFGDALLATRSAGARSIEGDRRAAILAGYEELVQVMPQAFALDLDRSQRESVILQSLLLQIPDVKKVTIDKLYAAGLSTLEAMLLANPGDVAATTGLDMALATRIVEHFHAYREKVRTAVPDATRAQERQTIATLTARLRAEHRAFEAAAQGWSREAEEKKKELRKLRAQTLLDIQVVLARLGEVERLKEIERVAFEKKLIHLEAFLEEARDKYVAQP
jgi:hypothetical protein